MKAVALASALALLHRQIADVAHEGVGSDRRGIQVRVPVARARGEDDVVAFLANEP